jgi:aryl-alcohol dehydrogenase-like predicted oxidoreductase
MKYKKLGNTGLMVSELCLGTMNFGGKPKPIGSLSDKVSRDLISISYNSGINFFNTADVYSEGESEKILGKSLHNLKIPRDKIIITTKVNSKTGDGPNDMGLSRKHIFTSVENSLRNLKTDYIDLYEIHAYDPLTPPEETLNALNDLVSNGYVRYIGCSNLLAWQIMKAIGISDKLNFAKFRTLEAYYSIGCRDIERETVPLLEDQNIALLVWSPLAGGFLTGKFRKGKKYPANARRTNLDSPKLNKEKAFEIIDVMEKIANAKDASISHIALAWLLTKEYVTSVILGARNSSQLKEDIKCLSVSLTDEDLNKLEEVSKLDEEYPKWMVDKLSKERLESAGVK